MLLVAHAPQLDPRGRVEGLYSLPEHYKGRKLDARADQTTVRFYDPYPNLVKTHLRVPPGKRQTDAADFPPEKAAYALRDVRYLVRKAKGHGEAVGRYAEALPKAACPGHG